MKKFSKKAMAIFLAMLMLFCVAPVMALAEETPGVTFSNIDDITVPYEGYASAISTVIIDDGVEPIQWRLWQIVDEDKQEVGIIHLSENVVSRDFSPNTFYDGIYIKTFQFGAFDGTEWYFSNEFSVTYDSVPPVPAHMPGVVFSDIDDATVLNNSYITVKSTVTIGEGAEPSSWTLWQVLDNGDRTEYGSISLASDYAYREFGSYTFWDGVNPKTFQFGVFDGVEWCFSNEFTVTYQSAPPSYVPGVTFSDVGNITVPYEGSVTVSSIATINEGVEPRSWGLYQTDNGANTYCGVATFEANDSSVSKTISKDQFNDEVYTKTFQFGVYDGSRWCYSKEFTVTYQSTPPTYEPGVTFSDIDDIIVPYEEYVTAISTVTINDGVEPSDWRLWQIVNGDMQEFDFINFSDSIAFCDFCPGAFYDGVNTKTFRLGAYDGTNWCYSNEFTVTYISSPTTYSINITAGKAFIGEGEEVSRAAAGEIVTITANEPESGMLFDEWRVSTAGVTLDNKKSAVTTFTMPEYSVSIFAVYKQESSGDETPTLESIRIETNPTVTSYKVGDTVSLEGLKIMAVYSDTSEIDVTSSVTVSNFNAATAGNKTATVEFEGKTATFNYTVEEATAPIVIPTIKINNNPGTKEIKYGEGIKFTATATDMPEGAKIVWFVDGKNAGEGESFTFSDAKADATITVKIVDKDGNVMKDATDGEISESEKVTVKAGFFQKLISFFKNLFKKNRIIAQSIDSKKISAK